jgi:hypothetical protein
MSILYKYVGLDTAIKILQSGTLGFSKFSSFNDPFETLTLRNSENLDLFKNNPDRVSQRYVAACLTRSNDNSLMWSHYAEQHKGVVIGYDVDCEELRSKEENLIPIHLGSVIYSRTMPSGVIDLPISFGDRFSQENYDALQHVFLMKANDWFYEEEVRVVKALLYDPCDPNQPSLFSLTDDQSSLAPLDSTGNTFLFRMPMRSIKEIIIGYRVDLDDPTVLELLKAGVMHNHDIFVGRSQLEPNTWKIRVEKMDIEKELDTFRADVVDFSYDQEDILFK